MAEQPGQVMMVIIKAKPEFRRALFDSLKNDDNGIKFTRAQKGTVAFKTY